MTSVGRDGNAQPERPGGLPTRREEMRAASLRANLQRRKAQARGRADLAGDPNAGNASLNESRSD